MKLLVIVGPTAVGKTELALDLAKKFGGELISADSRQVYRKMDIATGKEKERYKNVPVYLIDVVGPKESFSVAQFTMMAEKVIVDIHKRGKLPILVGGTGLYIKAVIDGIDTIGVPPNQPLRAAYARKTTDELFEVLLHLNPELASRLNPSERKNKQRLIRKIEIEQKQSKFKYKSKKKREFDVLFVGLTAAKDVLKERIWKRVDGWVKEGIEKEIKSLLDSGVTWQNQSMSALGYRQWRPYFEQKATREQVIKKWKSEEWQYARRQMTWFRKDKRICWFDVIEDGWRHKVEKLAENWYDK